MNRLNCKNNYILLIEIGTNKLIIRSETLDDHLTANIKIVKDTGIAPLYILLCAAEYIYELEEIKEKLK